MNRKHIISLFLSLALLTTSLTGCGKRIGNEFDAAGSDSSSVEEGNKIISEENTEASDSGDISQEFEYYTDDKNILYYNLPETVLINGKTYQVTQDISYEDLEEKKVVQKAVDVDVEELGDIPETTEYIGKDGRKYTLRNDQVYIVEENVPITVPVVETVTYADQITKPSVSNSKTITYYNKVTEKDDQTTGQLEAFYESAPFRWKDILKIDGVFQAPSANCDTYMLQGMPNVVVSQSAETPAWGTYQTDVLQSLELAPDHFRVNSAVWNGAQYTQDGNVMRNALFTGDIYVADYTARYVGEGQALGYRTKIFYRVNAEDLTDVAPEDITTIYKIKAIVRYRLVEGK